jgi:AraC family transcriptional regulator
VHRPAVAHYPPGAGLPLRVIKDYEFVWMLRGRASFVMGGEERLLMPGQLLLVPPRVQHSLRWDPDEASRHGYVHFGQEDVSLSIAPQVRLVRMSSADPLAGLRAYLLWVGSSEGSGWEVAVRRTLEFMLTLLEAGPLPSEEVSPRVAQPMRGVVSHLQREWSQLPLRVGIAELAAAANVSRGYLNRLFREAFGMTASVALERVRCSQAEALLTRTDLTIAAIARQCGYADSAHFSHRFSNIHGIPPSQYRILGNTSPSVLDQPGVLQLSRLVWD